MTSKARTFLSCFQLMVHNFIRTIAGCQSGSSLTALQRYNIRQRIFFLTLSFLVWINPRTLILSYSLDFTMSLWFNMKVFQFGTPLMRSFTPLIYSSPLQHQWSWPCLSQWTCWSPWLKCLPLVLWDARTSQRRWFNLFSCHAAPK